MNGFLYFIEDKKTVTQADLTAAGLGYAFEADYSFRETTTGPSGKAGSVIGVGDGVGYFPARQKWTPMPGKVGIWIGSDNDSPPSPEDLARSEQIAGYSVTLGCGRNFECLIPVARVFPEGTRFPQAMLIGKDGKLVKKHHPPVC